MTEQLSLHWLTVGYVSPSAKEVIIAHGGRVDEISHDPAFLAVGLAHDPAGYWSWSHGERQYRSSIEFWNTEEIQMEHLTLQWGPRCPEYHSVEDTYLIQPWEDFDPETRQVKPELEIEQAEQQPAAAYSGAGTDDFDPFLDLGELS